jgi:hypothetical protein
MSSAIFGAIGRGYSARTILQNIGRRFPQQAQNIATAYYAGYTAQDILARIASRKDNKHYDPDDFLTDHERTRNRDDKQKTQALMKAVAVAGATGAIAAGAYQLYKRNLPVRPEVLPALPKHNAQGQLPAPQQQLALPAPAPRHPPRPNNPQSPLNRPNQPINPIMGVQPQSQQQQQPIQNVPQQQMEPQAPARDIQKTVDMIKNLRESARFENVIDGGFDDDTTALILRKTAPKELLQIIDQKEGGLKQVVDDYRQFLKSSKQQQPQEQQKQQTPSFSNPPPERAEIKESVTPQEIQNNDITQPNRQQNMAETKPVSLNPQNTNVQNTPLAIQNTKPLGMTANGKIGEIEGVKNNVTTMNMDGKQTKEKESSIIQEPKDLEPYVREIVDSIPEGMKSTHFQSMVHVPGLDLMLIQFYGGKWVWYKDVPKEKYSSIAMGKYTPKGQAITGIGEYDPNVTDSRGAGFDQEIKKDPMYSKENKNITWGYADNEYSLLNNIQESLHKISKERYDKSGNLIQPQKRKRTNS